MAVLKTSNFCLMVVSLLVVGINHTSCHTKHSPKHYYVGDKQHWGYTFLQQNWAMNKTFHARDILVFKYIPGEHNVVKVRAAEDYDMCRVGEGSVSYSTGYNKIKLQKGHNYFICGIPAHCGMGMKLMVYAH